MRIPRPGQSGARCHAALALEQHLFAATMDPTGIEPVTPCLQSRCSPI